MGKNPAAMALGRMGGLKGGPASAAKLTSPQRIARARKAARARWGEPSTRWWPSKGDGTRLHAVYEEVVARGWLIGLCHVAIRLPDTPPDLPHCKSCERLLARRQEGGA